MGVDIVPCISQLCSRRSIVIIFFGRLALCIVCLDLGSVGAIAMELELYVKRMGLLKAQVPTLFEHEQRLLFVTNLSEFLGDRNYQPSANALDASLDALSKVLMLHPEFTLKVVKLFLPIVPELVARQLSCEDTDAVNITRSSRLMRNEKIALSLSLILPIVPQISYTIISFFQSNATRLFQRLIDLEGQESDVENILSSMTVSPTH